MSLRDEFEKTLFPSGFGLFRGDHPTTADQYISPYTSGAWAGYQAGRERQAEIIERLTAELAAAHRILDNHKIQFRPTDGEK